MNAERDHDGDGLSNREECLTGTDPLKRDLDGDGLSCREECLTGTDPLTRDTDGDGRAGALETGGWCLRHDCAHGVCACDGDAWLKVGVGDSAPATLFRAESGDWCWLHEQAVSNCVTCTGTADVTVPEFPYRPDPWEGWEWDPTGANIDLPVPTDTLHFSVGFSQPAVIFEDGYANCTEDGGSEWHERRSTRTRLTVTASGGARGGWLTIGWSGIEKLTQVDGTPLSLAEFPHLGPGETFKFTCEFEGVKHSDVTNDIVVCGYVLDDATGEWILSEASLTAVELQFSPQDQFPMGYPHRHVCGVCEKVDCKYLPVKLPGREWACDSGWFDFDETETLDVSNSHVYQFDHTSENVNLKFKFKDVVYQLSVESILPENAICQDEPEILSFGLQQGQSGGVGMKLKLTLMPESVSFRGLRIWEDETTNGSPSGYFEDLRFADCWNHTRQNGAFRLLTVGERNMINYDTASLDFECPPLVSGGWDDGEIKWSIPYKWKAPKGFLYQIKSRDFTKKVQRFIIERTGTVSVEKYNWRVWRTVKGESGVLRDDMVAVPVNEELKNEN